jgi:hypothetical protein
MVPMPLLYWPAKPIALSRKLPVLCKKPSKKGLSQNKKKDTTMIKINLLAHKTTIPGKFIPHPDSPILFDILPYLERLRTWMKHPQHEWEGNPVDDTTYWPNVMTACQPNEYDIRAETLSQMEFE